MRKKASADLVWEGIGTEPDPAVGGVNAVGSNAESTLQMGSSRSIPWETDSGCNPTLH